MRKLFTFSITIIITLSTYAQSIDSLMVGYWPFNGSTDDSSKNQKATTAYGAKLAVDRFGKTASACYFDGIDDYIDIRDYGKILPKDIISISMWTKSLASRPQSQFMFETEASRCGISIDFYHDNRNTVFWDFGWLGDTEGNPPGRAYYRPLPFDEEWHHFVFTSNSETGQMRIFKDNVLITAESDALPMVIDQVKNLRIGSAYNTMFYYGYIDDIRIYSCEIGPKDVDALFNVKR